MSVTTIKDRLALICTTQITGIVSAFARLPHSLLGAELPAVVILTGEAGRTGDDDMLTVTRTFRLALLVKPWANGIELEAEALCEPFFERFETVFHARPSLQLADNTTLLEGILNADLGGDTGVTNIELGGIGYAGVLFDELVTVLREIKRMH